MLGRLFAALKGRLPGAYAWGSTRPASLLVAPGFVTAA
jgi:hypothetical protein